MSTFLASSLNIELVNIILQGITRFSDYPIEINIQNHELEGTCDKFKVQRLCRINKIEIYHPEIWEVANNNDFLENKFVSDMTDIGTGVEKEEQKLIANKIVINETVEIYELAPQIFKHIRELDGITNDEIKSSLHPDLNRDMVFKAGESQGKSGSFFFFSHDKKFIIKTMNEGELNTF